MSRPRQTRFRIPKSWTDQYRPWVTADFEGFVDRGLFELMTANGVVEPEQLFGLPGAETARDRRNLTSRVCVQDRALWIKRFRPGHVVDGIMYAPGHGKAVYAWNAAMALMEKGICTPRPLIGLRGAGPAGGARGIAAFEEIEAHASLQHLLADPPVAETRGDMVCALGGCLRRFHDHGFRHRDLRQGNILVAGSGNDWSFCFLDLNRLRLQSSLTETQRLREVEKLNLPVDVLEVFFDSYMPGRDPRGMSSIYKDRGRYADRLEHLLLGKLVRKAWYYSWELRSFARSRRP